MNKVSACHGDRVVSVPYFYHMAQQLLAQGGNCTSNAGWLHVYKASSTVPFLFIMVALANAASTCHTWATHC